MAINSVINESAPDGSVITVSQLDNADRTQKVDERERLEDSIIDSAIATWNSTTTKELQEGLARVHTTTRAAKAAITRLHDGKVWIGTDGDNTNAFEYYNGAAWTAVPIGTANLLTNAVTNPKITAGAVHGLRANLSNTANDTVAGASPTLIGTTAGTDFTVTFTVNNSNSTILLAMFARPSLSGGGASDIGHMDFTHDSGGTTVIDTFATSRQDQIATGTTNQRHLMTCISMVSGLTGSVTFQARMYATAGQTICLEGDEFTARFFVVELMK